MGKKEFIQIILDRAVDDASTCMYDFSTLIDKKILLQIAVDEWRHRALPALEWAFIEDRKSLFSRLSIDIHEAIEKYKLVGVYKKAYMNAVVVKFGLEI